MSGIIEVPVQWDTATFPASRSYVGRFMLQSVQSITDIAERDIYRHLCDRNAQGRLVFIPDEVSEVEANAFELSPVTAHQASLQPKAGQSPSQKQRFLLGLIWEELQGQGPETSQEDYYQERMAENVKKLSNELEDLRRIKFYAGREV